MAVLTSKSQEMPVVARWDDAIRAALLSGVRPAVDPRDMDTAGLSDLGVTTALLDQGGDRVGHCDNLRSSQPFVKPFPCDRIAKIATDAASALRDQINMDYEAFSAEWLAANFARTGAKQVELVRYLQSQGIAADASMVSKAVAGRRTIQPAERLPVWEFFGYHRDQLWEAFLRFHPDAKASEQYEILPLKDQLNKEQSEKSSTSSKLVPMPNAGLPEAIPETSGKMPILGKSVGGNNKDRSLFNGEALGFVSRPGNLSDKPRAYATYVHGESMEPRYEAGEIVLVNPDKGYRKGNYVVAQVYENDGDPPFGYVKRFVSFGEDLVLEQLNPPEGEDRFMRFPRENVVAVHRIVGTLDE